MKSLPSLTVSVLALAVLVSGCGHGDGVNGNDTTGSFIVFASDRDGDFEIYVMDADGSNPTNLTNHAAWDGDVAWSPMR